jgi:hypothetical protein
MGRKLVIDGVQQAQSVLSGDIMDMQNAQALKYIFSADSKHFAHFAVSPSAATVSNGVFLDGKFIPTTSQGTGTDLRFSPDSKHLFWIHRYGDQPYRLFIDGKPLADFTHQTIWGRLTGGISRPTALYLSWLKMTNR